MKKIQRSKKYLVMAAAEATNTPHSTAEKIISEFINQLTLALLAGEKVQIRGMGTWGVKTRGSRMGRNPRTGEAITIPLHKIVKFKPSAKLMERLNTD